MNARPFRSIASVLIQRTIVLAVLCMLCVFVVQSWLLRSQHQKQFEAVMSDLANTSVPLLAAALWDIETQAVQAQLQFIAKKPEIGFAHLEAAGGQVFEAGDPALARREAVRSITIYAPHGTQALGVLHLSGNPHYLWQSLKAEALRILLGYSALTAGICVLIAFLLKQLLQKPLSTVAGFASELTPHRLTTPLKLNRAPQPHADEIDLLEQGVVKLQTALHEHIHNLDGLVNERTAQLEHLLEEIRQLSVTDSLTGCYNRRALQDRLPEEIDRARRYHRPLAVVFMDIDHFKQFNDTHGHQLGDEVLRSAAGHVAAALRQGVDWIARYGGEEFVLVLPETNLEAAIAIAHRLCDALPRLSVAKPDGGWVQISASFGVTVYRSGEEAPALLARADALVYQAKSAGRQQVVAAA